MSNLNSRRGQLWLYEGRGEPTGSLHLGFIGIAAVLLIGLIMGAAEIHLLPTFSADDIGSILFGAG
jgi:hypothetical protein